MATKARLSASVDPSLIAAGERAVKEGLAPSISAWVTAALTRQAEHDELLRKTDVFIEAFEAEYGKITDDDIANAVEWLESGKIEVGPAKSRPRSGSKAVAEVSSKSERRRAS